MGMKDQSQHKAGEMQQQAKDKLGQGHEKTGRRGQQPQGRQGQQSKSQPPQPGRGSQHENMRDIEDSDREMEDRFDRDYDA
ncbi:hypothetical protein [Streptomyces sp. MMG1121]|uniref:hypothetical protein n=1 Tax=Streptomyces sp. MMG1121 TaxID=1415544 RepID=UPI0006AF1C9D|nr:hypothetical protein [Streptomyces sp. MMG1121]KOV62715.1 hypothetical protein ADK64_23420 [Streptomyces sp. MMG1121]